MNYPPAPKLPFRLLKLFCIPEYYIDIEGDLLELYQRRIANVGSRKAKYLLYKDVLQLFRPGMIRAAHLPLQTSIMLRHNLILALRNFNRNKTSFLINLIGLSTGLACMLLIYLWVHDEMSIDKFHDKDGQLYHAMANLDAPHDILTLESTPIPMAAAMVEEMPEVEYAVSVNDFISWRHKEGIMSQEDTQVETKGIYASKDFFKVFSYRLLSGDPDHILTQKDGIILSEKLAKKLFPSTDHIIGQTVEWKHSTFEGVFQVSGILEDLPANTTEAFDFILSLDVLLANDPYAKNWTSHSAKTYLILRKGTDIEAFNEKIADYININNPVSDAFTLFVQKYSDKYLHGKYEHGVQVGGRISYVKMFSLIALFILLIACINFMNLSTAQAAKKMKEVGVKKALGINREALVVQFIGESMLLTLMALLLAIQLAYLFLPQFNEIAGKDLHLSFNGSLVLGIVGITLITGFLSGSYPAFYLSSFKPAMVLKGKFNISFGELWMRKGLVIFQFSLSILFIVGLLVINDQIQLAQTKNMGYDRDNVISFDWKGNLYNEWNGLKDGKSNEQFYSFMRELKEVPGVVNASNMSGNILDDMYGQTGITWSGQESDKDVLFQSPLVGYDFIETLDIELLEGRTFSEIHQDDYSKIVVNETAVKFMGLENPIGEIIGLNDGSEIIGVVKDFHYGSIHNDIEPLIFRCELNGRNILTKIKAGTEKATLARLEEHYSKFLPGYSFEFNFLDDDYQAMYEAEQKVSNLSRYFAGLAILISCLGLFGLATFTAEQRRKEIGIRKVLGSSNFGIMQLLSKDFTKTVIIAIAIALPLSYLIASKWLENFAFKITLHWGIFVGTGLLVLFIAWLTIGLQTFQAARINPIQSLKQD